MNKKATIVPAVLTLFCLIVLIFQSRSFLRRPDTVETPPPSPSIPSSDFKPGSEPDGFRGIKWGQDIFTVPGLKYIMGEIPVFTRDNDEEKIGAANLRQPIEYEFREGKFYGVGIYTEGEFNYEALKEVVFEKFGPGNYRFGETYYWYGERTRAVLRYDKFSGEKDWLRKGVLRMTSAVMDRQKEEYKKQKAKEGAEKGF